jgi:hypothetical protein
MTATPSTPRYVVFFAKLILDLKATPGQIVRLDQDGIFFGGGPHTSFEQAEADARDIVCRAKERARGTLLPRVFEILPDENLIDASYRAQEWYEAKISEMNAADEAGAHTGRCAKARESRRVRKVRSHR